MGKVPAGLTGTALTGVTLSESTKTVTADTDQEEVAKILARYDLLAVPVLNAKQLFVREIQGSHSQGDDGEHQLIALLQKAMGDGLGACCGCDHNLTRGKACAEAR